MRTSTSSSSQGDRCSCCPVLSVLLLFPPSPPSSPLPLLRTTPTPMYLSIMMPPANSYSAVRCTMCVVRCAGTRFDHPRCYCLRSPRCFDRCVRREWRWGSFVGVTVIGARYGFDMRSTAGYATVVSATSINARALVGPSTLQHDHLACTAAPVGFQHPPRLRVVLARRHVSTR